MESQHSLQMRLIPLRTGSSLVQTPDFPGARDKRYVTNGHRTVCKDLVSK
jgi:hypothetical protein